MSISDKDYKQQILNKLSASFCGAKWYNATIWLGSGMTTSCHHPPAHKISVESIRANYRALHNTPEKRDDRAKMQRGDRPAGCEYCWKIEDLGRDAVSDRVYKSKIYSEYDLNAAFNTPVDADVNLKTLEIAFDRTCQFACSYCNPAFSSTWVNDIRRNGPYTHLVSDGRNHFTHTHDSAQLYKFGSVNPYVEAFFQWWESDLHRTLGELRITGGEPLMSAHTWQLIDWFKNNPGRSHTRLAINSNLGTEVDLGRLIDSVAGLEVDIYTSQEATGTAAEYIRDGLEYEDWQFKVNDVLKSKAIRSLHFMATINALCLPTLVEHIEYLRLLKEEFGRDRVSFTLNILRFPSFQSPLVLSDELRQQYMQRLSAYLETVRNNPLFHEHELNHMQRLIDYLDVAKTPHSDSFDLPALRNDFKKFYEQYDQRRNKNFASAFPELTDWYKNL